MRSLLQRLGRATDRALSAVIWLHDSVMLFICLFWLLPLIVLVVISAFIFDLRPILRDRMQEVFLYSLLGSRSGSAFASTHSSQQPRHPTASGIGWGACPLTLAMCFWALAAYSGCSVSYEV